jgi:class 3 adenylate cyclase
VKEQRRLAAIMFSDICGFTKIMGHDENLAVSFAGEHERIMKFAADRLGGRIIKKMGDGLLVGFVSAVNAVSCAVAVQKHLRSRNRHIEEHQIFHVRIGVHVGDVLISSNDILGDGVNIASRIETLAEPGGICISGDVYEMVRSRMSIQAVPLGSRRLKHVRRRIPIYRIMPGKQKKPGRWAYAWLKFIRLRADMHAWFRGHRKAVIAAAVGGAAVLVIVGSAAYAIVLDRKAMQEYLRAKRQADEFIAQQQPARAVWAMRSFPRRYRRTRWQTRVDRELQKALRAAAKERIHERYYAFWHAVHEDGPTEIHQFIRPGERDKSDVDARIRVMSLRMKHDQRYGTKFRIQSVYLSDNGQSAAVNLQVSGPESINGEDVWQDEPPSYWQLFEGDWYLCLDEPETVLENRDS